ncbi:hypothetical protein GOP47_0021761 [Adiantum capillus-veneris]|uniref:Uncharacterized protein n=1 Tax=Adiantum capillus-veneris TaxID=13818 RepID=A0A9D4U816_ADICA|nr:hypothetical protein GOP47_0021761 [Adiantum capillus-veneris]
MDMIMEASPIVRATEDVSLTGGVEVWRIPLGCYVDAVRWMPPATAWHQSLATALWDPDTGSFTLQLSSLSLDEGPSIHPQASWQLPARVSSLKTSPLSSQQALVASATFAGTISFIVSKLLGPDGVSPAPLSSSPIHDGAITGMDLQSDTHDCISVGEDGKINLSKLAESHLRHVSLVDNHGLTSFMAVHWASPAEFVTAGLGFSLQWWDHRRSGGPVQMSNKWTPGRGSGFIHTVDVHPSRKHVCVVGGSDGTVLAWDLRWQKEPIQLCGSSDLRGQPLGGTMAESDVWDVKFDSFSFSRSSVLSSKIPPIMMCSEDGILGVVEAGEAPWEILAEPCAINTFDINPESPTDVICGLEFESLLYVKRPS